MDTMVRTTRRSQPRPSLSGVSLLVLVTLTVASSAAAFEPVLSGLQDASAAAERQAVRLLPGSLAKAVRAGTGFERCSDIARTSGIPAAARAESPAITPVSPAAEPPRPLVRVALLDLPPPTA